MARRASLCLAALALAAGCTSTPGGGTGGGTGGSGGSSGGTGGSSGSGGGSASDPDAVCAAWADSICTKLDSCSHYFVRASYGDLATCKARAKLGCVPWFGAPGSGVTADGTNRCAAAYAASSCDDVANKVFPLECRVTGTFANGTACGDSAQCASSHCRIVSGLCGTCQPRENTGGGCFVDGDCEHALVCAGGVCVAPGDTGAACSQIQPCKDTHVCTSGQCRRRITTAGTSCDVQNDNCDINVGLWCNLDTAKCDAVQLTGGVRCGFEASVLTLCLASADCRVPMGVNVGSCVAPANDGQACTAAAPGAFSCFSPGDCISGTCKLPSPTLCQ